MQSPRVALFLVGSKAVNLFEISHYWVAPEGPEGPTLCISMKNGKQINFDQTDGAGDGYAVEKGLIHEMGRVAKLF